MAHLVDARLESVELCLNTPERPIGDVTIHTMSLFAPQPIVHSRHLVLDPSYRPAIGNGEGVVAALDAFSTQIIDRLRADGAEIVCVASLRSLHLLLANVDGHVQGRGLQLQPHEALGEGRAALQSGLRAYRLEREREHRYEEVEEEDEGEDCEEEVDQ